MINDLFSPLGVVPIFVNAGAALVPTLIASFTSVVAILFKPKELLAVCRRNPWLPVAVVMAILGMCWFIYLVASPAQAGPTVKNTLNPFTAPYPDWSAFAFKLIADQENANKTTGVKPLWEYQPERDAMIFSEPAYSAASNRVFCTAAVQDVASLFGLLYCVDANTGSKIWQIDKAGDEDFKAFFSSPALTADEKYLVIGQGFHDDADCSLLCFDTNSRELKWKVKTTLHIESSPAIRGDLAVVGCGAIEDASHKPKTHPGYVLAVRISDGKELWRHDVNDPESSPAIAEDGSVYIGAGFNGNAVVALRSESDDELKSKNLTRQLWKTPAPYPITGPITIHGDLILAGGGNSDFVYADAKPAGVVIALDRKTGQVRWQTPMPDSVLNKIVVHNNIVFCPVRDGQVTALSLADGKPIWRQSISGKSPILAGLAISKDGNTLFAASQDGYLALLSPADGKILDRHPLNAKGKPGTGKCFSTPTLAGDRLFIGSETGGLRCFQSVKPTGN